MPDFENEQKRDKKGIITSIDLTEPPQAFMWGWEQAMLECGELLAKATAEAKSESIQTMLERVVKSKNEVMQENEAIKTEFLKNEEREGRQ